MKSLKRLFRKIGEADVHVWEMCIRDRYLAVGQVMYGRS